MIDATRRRDLREQKCSAVQRLASHAARILSPARVGAGPPEESEATAILPPVVIALRPLLLEAQFRTDALEQLVLDLLRINAQPD